MRLAFLELVYIQRAVAVLRHQRVRRGEEDLAVVEHLTREGDRRRTALVGKAVGAQQRGVAGRLGGPTRDAFEPFGLRVIAEDLACLAVCSGAVLQRVVEARKAGRRGKGEVAAVGRYGRGKEATTAARRGFSGGAAGDESEFVAVEEVEVGTAWLR